MFCMEYCRRKYSSHRDYVVFCTGLGDSLLLAGILFDVNYAIALSDAAKEKR